MVPQRLGEAPAVGVELDPHLVLAGLERSLDLDLASLGAERVLAIRGPSLGYWQTRLPGDHRARFPLVGDANLRSDGIRPVPDPCNA